MVLDFIKMFTKIKKTNLDPHLFVNLCRLHKISTLTQNNYRLTTPYNKSVRKLMINENFHKHVIFYFHKSIKNALINSQSKTMINKNTSASFLNKNYYASEKYFRSHSYPLLGSNLSNNIYNLSTNTSDKQILSLLDTSWEPEQADEGREKVILQNLSTIRIRYRNTFVRKRRGITRKLKTAKYESFYKHYHSHKKFKSPKRVHNKHNTFKQLRLFLRKKLLIFRIRSQKFKNKKRNKMSRQKNKYQPNSAIKISLKGNFSLNTLLNFRKRKKEPIIQFINSRYNNKLLKNALINPQQIISSRFLNFVSPRNLSFSQFNFQNKKKSHKSIDKRSNASSNYLIEAKLALLKRKTKSNSNLITKLGMKKSYIFFNKTIKFLHKMKLLKSLKLKNFSTYVSKDVKQKPRKIISINNYTSLKTKTK